MILRDALFKGIETLRNAKIETPDTDAGVMLCSVLKRDRVFLYTHGDEILDDSVLNRFFECIALRAAGMPVQYITGVQEFMSWSSRLTPMFSYPGMIPRYWLRP